jgi:hypothetical protein
VNINIIEKEIATEKVAIATKEAAVVRAIAAENVIAWAEVSNAVIKPSMSRLQN